MPRPLRQNMHVTQLRPLIQASIDFLSTNKIVQRSEQMASLFTARLPAFHVSWCVWLCVLSD